MTEVAATEGEMRAYGLVAQAIAQHAFDQATAAQAHDRSVFPDPRPIYYHQSMSAFEAAAEHLWRLRILRPLDEKSGWALHFVFDCEVNDSKIVAEHNRQEGPTFSELLATFVNLFGDFGKEKWGFSTERGMPFGNNSPIKPALEALASLGYLTTTENGYLWTDLIAPIMCASTFWPNPTRRAD
jgi:hypothetical protein